MVPTISAVHGKARAFVEALTRLPRSVRAAVPHGHFARDYNTLRRLALEAAPGLDERLLGKYIAVYETASGEFSQASYVEIEVYARQIMEQLALLGNVPNAVSAPADPVIDSDSVPAKAYDVATIRKEYGQAYAPWSEQDDEYLRFRFLQGASLEDLVLEFGRNPGGIRSRLRKLGLLEATDGPNVRGYIPRSEEPVAQDGGSDRPASSVPDWKQLRPRAGKAWTPEEDATLLQGLDAGLSLEDLARQLGRGVFSVEVRLSKLRNDASGRKG
jgi:hypothetical protein